MNDSTNQVAFDLEERLNLVGDYLQKIATAVRRVVLLGLGGFVLLCVGVFVEYKDLQLILRTSSFYSFLVFISLMFFVSSFLYDLGAALRGEKTEEVPVEEGTKKLVMCLVLGAVGVFLAASTVGTAHAQGVPRETLFPGIQAPLIGMTRDGPIYGQVDVSALVAQRQQLLAQSQVPDPNFGGTMTQLTDCSYAAWRTTSAPTSPYIERIWRERQEQEARARRAEGNQANVPGFSPQQKLVHWKNALLPFTTEPVEISLELWSKEALKQSSLEQFAFYKADFRSHLRGQLLLPRLPDPEQAEFKIKWQTNQVVLEGEIETLLEILKQGAQLLPVINMTDPAVRAQVVRGMPKVLDEGWRASMGNPYLRGEHVPPPGCPPFTDAQKRQIWGDIQSIRQPSSVG